YARFSWSETAFTAAPCIGFFPFSCSAVHPAIHSFPTRRSSDLTYSTEEAANNHEMCLACAPGKYSEVVGADTHETCSDCAPGTLSRAGAAVTSDTCTRCDAGTYSTEAGADEESDCVACAAGKYS